MMGYGGYGMMGFGGILMLLWSAVVIGGIVLIILGMFKIFRRNKGKERIPANDSALEQLKIRFASGEISKEEYLERKRILDAN